MSEAAANILQDVEYTIAQVSENIRACILSGNVGGADLWASTLKQCCEARECLSDD